MSLLEAIETHPLCGDGTIGTLLEERGAPANECVEALCISRPDLVREIHADYVKAGATSSEPTPWQRMPSSWDGMDFPTV